jgi:hypothetical protein
LDNLLRKILKILIKIYKNLNEFLSLVTKFNSTNEFSLWRIISMRINKSNIQVMKNENKMFYYEDPLRKERERKRQNEP